MPRRPQKSRTRHSYNINGSGQGHDDLPGAFLRGSGAGMRDRYRRSFRSRRDRLSRPRRLTGAAVATVAGGERGGARCEVRRRRNWCDVSKPECESCAESGIQPAERGKRGIGNVRQAMPSDEVCSRGGCVRLRSMHIVFGHTWSPPANGRQTETKPSFSGHRACPSHARGVHSWQTRPSSASLCAPSPDYWSSGETSFFYAHLRYDCRLRAGKARVIE
jgi:hypothetical protein